MDNILLFIYYVLVVLIYCFEFILSFYILLQLVVIFFSVSESNMFYRIYTFLMVRLEPILLYFRKFVPSVCGIDFSILIIFFGLDAIRQLISIIFTYLLSR